MFVRHTSFTAADVNEVTIIVNIMDGTTDDQISSLSITNILGLGTVLLLVIFHLWRYSFFIRRGIPGPMPVPIFGNTIQLGKGIHYAYDDYIKKYGNFCGLFKFYKPTILVSDPDIIKEILIKEFENFRNREVIPVNDPSINNALFISRDENWRKIRHTLTPAFSGRKMKLMSKIIPEPADTLVKSFRDICKNKKGMFECRDLFGAFVMDTVARCAFGLSVDSQTNKDDPFVSKARRFFASVIDFTNPYKILTILFPMVGKVLGWFGIYDYPKDVIDFFKSIIDKAIDLRKHGKQDKEKVDFLQLIVNAADDNDDDDDDETGDDVIDSMKKIKREPLNPSEVMSQAMAFFVVGYDTTSSAISFVTYLLATNPDQQDRLIGEIDRLMPTADDVTYENMKQMTFLECVINESLRLYPPVTVAFRECDKSVTINGRTFPAGVSVNFPIWSIHRDPDYWEEPEKFSPDRFNKENKSKHHPFAWLPFGSGPRGCIGMRFAMMEVKTAVIRILQEFRFEVAPETEIPPTLGKLGFLTPPNGITLRAVPRRK